MSKYAKIEKGFVTNIIICDNDVVDGLDGVYVSITNETNDCQIGYEYIPEKNKFKSESPYQSWTLNEETILWEAPADKPTGEGFYRWDEATQDWIKVS